MSTYTKIQKINNSTHPSTPSPFRHPNHSTSNSLQFAKTPNITKIPKITKITKIGKSPEKSDFKPIAQNTNFFRIPGNSAPIYRKTINALISVPPPPPSLNGSHFAPTPAKRNAAFPAKFIPPPPPAHRQKPSSIKPEIRQNLQNFPNRSNHSNHSNRPKNGQNSENEKNGKNQYVSYHNNNYNNFYFQTPSQLFSAPPQAFASPFFEKGSGEARAESFPPKGEESGALFRGKEFGGSSPLETFEEGENSLYTADRKYVNPFLSSSAFHRAQAIYDENARRRAERKPLPRAEGNDYSSFFMPRAPQPPRVDVHTEEKFRWNAYEEKLSPWQNIIEREEKLRYCGLSNSFQRSAKVPMTADFATIKSNPICKSKVGGEFDLSALKRPPREIRPGKRRPRKMFTDEEVNNLIQGVKQFGHGKWARILQFFQFDDRTAVDLKDKWRNLQKPSSTVKVPKDRRTRLPYSDSECHMLHSGVQVFGHNWVAILRAYPFHSERTPVDLKDKWRNLQIKSGRISPPPKRTRRFLLLDSDNAIFVNVYPREAALKAAARGLEYIKLLQIGTPRIHVFAGERAVVQRFLGRQKGSVWKGRVVKLGMERATVEQLRVAKARFARQFGLKSAHEIAPNVKVDPTNEFGTVQPKTDVFTTKLDEDVMQELRMKKDPAMGEGEAASFSPMDGKVAYKLL